MKSEEHLLGNELAEHLDVLWIIVGTFQRNINHVNGLDGFAFLESREFVLGYSIHNGQLADIRVEVVPLGGLQLELLEDGLLRKQLANLCTLRQS